MLRLTLFRKEPIAGRAEIVGKAAQLKRCRIVRRTPFSVQASTCFIMRQTHPLPVVIDLQRGMKELLLQGIVWHTASI